MRSPHVTYAKPANPEDFNLATKYAELMKVELKEFLIEIVFFGSAVKTNHEKIYESDIDVLVILEDMSFVTSPEVVEAYRIIAEKTAAKVSRRFHITTMRLLNWWEYVMNGDPIIVNVLREGVPLTNAGFFEPFHEMLKNNEIRPTMENVHLYFQRAPQTLQASSFNLLQGVIDMHWAMVDAAHAILLFNREIPYSPKHSFELLKPYVRSRKLKKQHLVLAKELNKMTDDILSRKLQNINGKQFEKLYQRTRFAVKDMNHLVSELVEKAL